MPFLALLRQSLRHLGIEGASLRQSRQFSQSSPGGTLQIFLGTRLACRLRRVVQRHLR